MATKRIEVDAGTGNVFSDPGYADAKERALKVELGDRSVLMPALRHVALAQGGVAEIARRSQLTREATYRTLSKRGNPELKSFTAVLAAAGLRLSVRLIGSVKPVRTARRNLLPA